MHRVTTPENLRKSRGLPQNTGEPRRTLGETPAEASKNPSEGEFLTNLIGMAVLPSWKALPSASQS